MRTLVLDGQAPQLEDLAPIVQGERLRLRVSADALKALKASRAMVDEAVRAGDAVYGITTGFGTAAA